MMAAPARIKPQTDQETPGKTPIWRVDNWQIPVPIGDCSAHFLLDTRGKAKVINAFIMDGGDDALDNTKATTKIELALTTLDKTYKSGWKFDAWVNTHQDADHWKGVSKLFNKKLTRNGINGTFLKLYFVEHPTIYCGGELHPDLKLPVNFRSRIHEEACIGIDFFSKTRMFKRHANAKVGESDEEHCVGKWNPNEHPGRPRFCAVAANGYGVHPDSDAQIKKSPDYNETSILAVVYWPGPGGGRTSYFTGGDGNPKVEMEGVVPWMEANAKGPGKKMTLPILPVAMLKLDHHGSMKENLNAASFTCFKTTLLSKMQPSKVICTPGDRHGHPSWPVLELISQYFGRQRVNNKKDKWRFYTTRSPYWFNKLYPNMKDANPAAAFNRKVAGMYKDDYDKYFKQPNDSDDSDDSDESEVNPAGLFLGSMSEYAVHKGDYADAQEKWRKSLEKRKDYKKKFLQKGGKSDSAAVYKAEKEETQKMYRDLRKAHKSSKSSMEEELMPDIVDKRMVMDENVEQIVSQAMQRWPEICDQRIAAPGANPYYLVRFSFLQNKDEPEVEYLNDDGEEKPGSMLIEPLNGLNPPPIKKDIYTYSESSTMNDRGGETYFVTQTDPKNNNQETSVFGTSFESLTSMLNHLNGFMTPHALSKINLFKPLVPKHGVSHEDLGLIQLSNYVHRPSNQPNLVINGRRSSLTQFKFGKKKVRNVITNQMIPFVFDLKDLDNFKSFLLKYSGIDLVSQKYKTENKQKTRFVGTASPEQILKMRRQWEKLVKLQTAHSTEEYSRLALRVRNMDNMDDEVEHYLDEEEVRQLKQAEAEKKNKTNKGAAAGKKAKTNKGAAAGDRRGSINSTRTAVDDVDDLPLQKKRKSQGRK